MCSVLPYVHANHFYQDGVSMQGSTLSTATHCLLMSTSTFEHAIAFVAMNWTCFLPHRMAVQHY